MIFKSYKCRNPVSCVYNMEKEKSELIIRPCPVNSTCR